MSRTMMIRRRSARLVGLTCWLLLLVGVASGLEARELSFKVRHRSTDTVYLEGGVASGLSVGDRLSVWRNSEQVAEIEVAFAAQHSASCKIISEIETIQSEDLARLVHKSLATIAGSLKLSDAVLAASPAASPAKQSGSSAAAYTSPARAKARRTRVGGTLTLDWESFSDASDAELDFDRLSARLNLRVRDLGGIPLSLRVRARSQQLERSRDFGGGATESETRDRLYEVSLRYDAPNDRFSLMGGRLGTSPFVGIGFLDGVLGEARVYKGLSVGGFWGSRPDITELGFESSGQKYGAYTRLAGDNADTLKGYDVVLGGVVEDGDQDVSREYAVLETQFRSGRKWSFYQRAEVDFNNDWREELADSSVELSNLALSVRTQLTETARLVVSYDQFRQYRTEETRFIPEELFNALLRQGLRVGVHVGQPRSLTWSVSAGLRDQEDGEEPSVNLGFGMRHPDVGAGISLRGDLLGFSNEFTEGGVLRVHSSRQFGIGHEVYLDLGGRVSTFKSIDSDDTVDSWVRLGFWAELPVSLFARGEFEFASGDNLEGSRISLGLGYRF